MGVDPLLLDPALHKHNLYVQFHESVFLYDY